MKGEVNEIHVIQNYAFIQKSNYCDKLFMLTLCIYKNMITSHDLKQDTISYALCCHH